MLVQGADQQQSWSTGTKSSVRRLLKLYFPSILLSKADSVQIHLLWVLHQNCHPHCSGVGSTTRNDKTDTAELFRVNNRNFLSSSSGFQGRCSEGTRKIEDVFKVVVRWKRTFIFINEDLDNFWSNRQRKICLKTGFPCGGVWRHCTFQEMSQVLAQTSGR